MTEATFAVLALLVLTWAVTSDLLARANITGPLVFALLAIEELGETELVDRAVAAVSLTVLMSVVLHGISAGLLGRRYVNLEQADADQSPGPRPRRSAHRHPGATLPRGSDQP